MKYLPTYIPFSVTTDSQTNVQSTGKRSTVSTLNILPDSPNTATVKSSIYQSLFTIDRSNTNRKSMYTFTNQPSRTTDDIETDRHTTSKDTSQPLQKSDYQETHYQPTSKSTSQLQQPTVNRQTKHKSTSQQYTMLTSTRTSVLSAEASKTGSSLLQFSVCPSVSANQANDCCFSICYPK